MAKISKYSLDESVSGGDKVIGTDGATGLTKNFSVNELGAYLQDVYNITGVITINGKDGVVTINTDDIPQGANNLYDKEVTLTGVGATQVTGEYPNFTISSTDNNTEYVAGDGISVLGGQISNTAPDLEVSLTGYGGAIVTGTYPNFNIEVVDKDTTYTAGSGISISNDNVITNTNQDRPINIVGEGATTVTGAYPNFTISSTDNNTLYSAGENIEIVGTTINAIIPPEVGEVYTAGDGISISEDNVISNTSEGTIYTAGSNITIDEFNVISAIMPGAQPGDISSYYYTNTGPSIENTNNLNPDDVLIFVDGLYQDPATYTYDGAFWNFSEPLAPDTEVSIISLNSISVNNSGGGVNSVVGGTSITVDNTDPLNPIINNSSPDQTVVLTGSGAATVTGTYPSFNVNTPVVNTDDFITNANDIYPSVQKVTDIISLTQAEYDALVPNDNAIYVIVG